MDVLSPTPVPLAVDLPSGLIAVPVDPFEGHTPAPWHRLCDTTPQNSHHPRMENEIAVVLGGRIPDYTTGPHRSMDVRDPLLVVANAEVVQGACAANALLIAAAPTLLAENRAKDIQLAQQAAHIAELRAALEEMEYGCLTVSEVDALASRTIETGSVAALKVERRKKETGKAFAMAHAALSATAPAPTAYLTLSATCHDWVDLRDRGDLADDVDTLIEVATDDVDGNERVTLPFEASVAAAVLNEAKRLMIEVTV